MKILEEVTKNLNRIYVKRWPQTNLICLMNSKVVSNGYKSLCFFLSKEKSFRQIRCNIYEIAMPEPSRAHGN